MSYTDIGFNQFLTRQQEDQQQEIDPLAFDQFTQEVSGSKIQGGSIVSPNGRVNVDLEQGSFKVNNGIDDLVQLGVLEDGSIGLLIKDINGNVLMQISDTQNIIQSSGQTMILNFNEDVLKILNDAGIIKVLVGKDIGGF